MGRRVCRVNKGVMRVVCAGGVHVSVQRMLVAARRHGAEAAATTGVSRNGEKGRRNRKAAVRDGKQQGKRRMKEKSWVPAAWCHAVVAGTPALAGAASGFIARLVVSPLDVLKVRMQVQVGSLGRTHSKDYYKTVTQALRLILKDEGIRGLWKGSIPGVLLWAPYNSIQFASLEAVKDVCQTMGLDRTSTRVSTVAGTIAGITATTATFPMDTIRTVLAAQGEPKMYNNVIDALVGLIKNRGVRALYAGLGTTLLEVAPFSAVEFGVYSMCRNTSLRIPSLHMHHLHRTRPLLENSDEVMTEWCTYYELDSATSGLIAGLVARVVIHPLDVVKKRFQVAGLQRSLRYGPAMKIGVSDSIFLVASKIIQQEGVSALFKGLTPGLVKAAVSSALCFTLYELVSDSIIREVSKHHECDKIILK